MVSVIIELEDNTRGPESLEKPSVQGKPARLLSDVIVSAVGTRFVLLGPLEALSLPCPLLLLLPGEPWPAVSEVLLPG